MTDPILSNLKPSKLKFADDFGLNQEIADLGIPVKVNISSGGKANGLPERK
jgi:hypothetical protein